MPGVSTLASKGLAPKPKARFGVRQHQDVDQGAAAPAVGEPMAQESQSSLMDEVEGDEAMYSHLLPKVMAPFETRSGETPRKVLIQRKRRQFAAQDVAALVQSEGVPPTSEEHFPLEIFDNTNYESRTHPEWVPRRPGAPPTSARALVRAGTDDGAGGLAWVPCTVIDYNEAANAYGVLLLQSGSTGGGGVQTASGDDGSGPGLGPFGHISDGAMLAEGRVIWLPRLKSRAGNIYCAEDGNGTRGVAGVCFSAEDPAVFARRYAEAHRSRARAESLLRYNLYIDSMPTDDIPPLTNEQVNRMLSFALNSKRLKDKLMDTSALIAEVNIEYARTMNKVVFDTALQGARAEKEAAAASGRAASAATAPLIPVNEDFPRDPPRLVPDKGTVPLEGSTDFPQQFSEFSFKTLLTKPEVITAITKIKVECAKVAKMCLFNTHYTKSARLEELEQGQLVALDSAGNYLKDSWCVALRNAIRNSFKDVGKGWFNLAEASMETYEFSKLRKFLTLTRFVMEDTMRGLVEDSLAKFTTFVQGCCPRRVIVHSTSHVEIQDSASSGVTIAATALSVAAAAAAAAAGGPGRKPPLLALDLAVSKEGGRFVYSTPPPTIITKIMVLFDAAITRTQGLHTLEPAIMENLFWATAPILSTVHPQEEGVVKLRESLRATLTAALVPLDEYMAKFEKYVGLLQLNVDSYVAALENKGADLSLTEVRTEIRRASADLESLLESVPVGISLGLVQINLSKTRELLVKKQEKLVSLLKGLAARVPRRSMASVSSKFAEIDRALKAKANNLEDVDEQRKYIEQLPNKIADLMAEVENQRGWYELLDQLRYLLPEDDLKEKFQGESWGVRLGRQAERQLEDDVSQCKSLSSTRGSVLSPILAGKGKVLSTDEARYKNEMFIEQDMFRDTIGDLQVVVSNFGLYTDLAKMDSVVAEVRAVDERLRKADHDATLFNSREALLGLPPTDYSPLRKVIETFDPFFQFWTTASNWRHLHKSWMHDSWEKLHGETVEREVNNAYKVLYKTGKVYAQRGMDKYAENCETVRAEVEAFKKFVPLVQALRNPGMRDRHWDQLSASLGFKLHPDKNFTLSHGHQMGLLSHLQVISKIADVAGKEYGIEQVLDYRETKTFVVKVDDQISQMMDDHIAMTQSMAFSPYKKPFEERIVKWEQQLNLVCAAVYVSEILDQWIQLQRQWMYLEPIFGSEDIMQQLPLEGKRFATVDRMWRKTTEAAKRNPLVLKVCSSQKLLDSFIEANKLLESVQKGLAEYLETKRLAFARFFFLSNDELLQILSQTKNPLAVQPHLRKCFEAIESLDFGSGGEISAMNSREKEKVPFDKSMMPQGNVEIWLGEVERRMRSSVRQQVMLSMAAYTQSERKQWVREWPAMVVLAVSAIFWSSQVEEAIKGGTVPAYLDRCTADLMDLTELVRGRLSSQERLTLGALITIDITDFEWVSRLRYYWRDEDVYVDMVQASISYGYEYLGNTPRLVITPLTDRCYMTLMSAMHMNLGGAPAGPAGTGKTETTKDLAKALAKQCVVFNCSDGLDYQAMAKFFKGLASSGAWACFDEFNRIDLEVLSVVAQQILTIQLAIQAKVKRFIFEDTEIDLNPACSVYITMNPGYAGRSELPDNLKALFRPCAMMVPDYALIAEICLYSYGYRAGKDLARKMVATFKLCSEQLSSQDHYDYGMRAVKSVITAAGNLKREFPDDNEEVLLLRALRDVNVPKFLSHDLPLFNGIITDLFPGVKMPEVDYASLLSALGESCKELGIQAVEPFVAKVIQLYETTIVRHGLMLVGPTMGGKTCCYRSLQKAMTKLAVAGDPKYERVRVVSLNPKSITMGQLYGEFDENTHEWTDGVLACYMRECSEDPKPDKKWIMFDGPVDAVWIENMNTVLDDNKKLCLVSGEIIQLSSSMTMMFEASMDVAGWMAGWMWLVEDLAVASPATVSRCGMVYMEPTALGLEPLLRSWLGRLPPGVSEHGALLANIFNALVPEGLRTLRKSLKETVATVNNNLVASCFGLMDSLLKAFERAEGQEPPTADEKAAQAAMLPSLMLFSIVWSVGASCDKAGRAAFDTWFRSQIRDSGLTLADGAMMPATGSVYDWVYDVTGSFTENGAPGWAGWMATVPEFRCDPDRPFAEIIVPTADTVRYTYLVDRLVAAHRHVLCVGETGTGKTLNVANKLLNDMPPEVQPLFMTFSARTSANQTQ
ncbi:dynein heavy chain 2, partial [Volvox carteri f. nagariensis]